MFAGRLPPSMSARWLAAALTALSLSCASTKGKATPASEAPTEAPGETESAGRSRTGARGIGPEHRDGGDVVGVGRVAHAEQDGEQQGRLGSAGERRDRAHAGARLRVASRSQSHHASSPVPSRALVSSVGTPGWTRSTFASSRPTS